MFSQVIKDNFLGLRSNGWQTLALLFTLVLLAPIVAIFYVASGNSDGLWEHLIDSVIPRYVLNTLGLMLGVAIVSLIFGVSTAWIVVKYDFKFRRVFEWLLLLPAAIPAYLIAYTYADFLEFSGPIQTGIRWLFGWEKATDYWFPEIRSLPGACILMGAVLYPYVYVMARVSFLLIPSSFFDVGLLANRNIFIAVALPIARPAIAAGLALVLMETVSDFGVVEYFAIETLTLGIFNVWLGMNNITAAAQIACLCFVFIILLIAMEVISRARQKFADTTKKSKSISPTKLSGLKVAGCWIVCCLPIIIGFFLPVGVLLGFIVKGYSVDLNVELGAAALNSLLIGISVACLVLFLSSVMLFTANYKGDFLMRRLVGLASIGYAFPGTILAIGVVSVFGHLDAAIAGIFSNFFNLKYSGWFGSGIGLIIVACVVRFQAVGYGAVSRGLNQIPKNVVEASQLLGANFFDRSVKIVLPMIRLSILAGGLLVFVDVMKELPMALLLRPFNFETLATYLYQFAKDELLEEAALPALMIVITGVIPVIFLNYTVNRLTRT